MQGWRVSMEDAHTAVLKLPGDHKAAFFAVFDGHGGEKTALFAGERTHELVASSEAFSKQDYALALKTGFLATDKSLMEMSDDATDTSGCAATSAIVTPEKITCANAGDSRTVLGRLGTAKPLSYDHKPDNEGERSRICAAGGFVDMGRVNGNLALSRALGDFNFKRSTGLAPEQQVVTAYPDIIEHAVDEEDEFLILACDGIWDCMTSQEVVEFVRRGIADKLSLPEICELLMEECLAPVSDMSGIGCDNMTVCIVALLQGKTKEEWYDMVAGRVERGEGPVAQQTCEEIRNRLSQRQAADAGSEDEEMEPTPSQLMIQQIFGGGDGVPHLDPEATSLLSRIGIRFNMHPQDADEDEVAEVHEAEGE